MNDAQQAAIKDTLETFFRLGVMDAKLNPHDIRGRVEISGLKNKHADDLFDKLANQKVVNSSSTTATGN